MLYKKNIQRLTKTFLTLSLSDVASRVGLSSPAEAEGHILQMVGVLFITQINNFPDEITKIDNLFTFFYLTHRYFYKMLKK